MLLNKVIVFILFMHCSVVSQAGQRDCKAFSVEMSATL